MAVFARGASLRRRVAGLVLFVGAVVGVSAVALVVASMRAPDDELSVPGFVVPRVVLPLAQSPAPQPTEPGATPSPAGTFRIIPTLPSPAFGSSPTTAPTGAPTGATPQPTAAAPTQGPPTTFPGRTPSAHPTPPPR